MQDGFKIQLNILYTYLDNNHIHGEKVPFSIYKNLKTKFFLPYVVQKNAFFSFYLFSRSKKVYIAFLFSCIY